MAADLVSVVISTYQRNELLFGRALPSVLGQTYQDMEVLVVADGMDGGPLTDLEERYRDLQFSTACPLKLWNIPRQSYPDDPTARWSVLGLEARNFGLDHARGEWIAPLDDDDEWTPTHVEDLLIEAVAKRADFAYGRSEYHWPDKHVQIAGRWPPGMGAFCDGAQIYRNGMGFRYDPACVERGLPEDGDLWIRMYESGVKFTFLPRIVHHYWPNPR